MNQKILFVCRSNTGRSQVAEALYNMEIGSKSANSAGTLVNDGIRTIRDKPNIEPLLSAMQKYDIDMSNNIRRQLVPSELDQYDTIIVMAEPENIPDWLSQHPRFVYWEIEDIKDKNTEDAARIISIIHKKVKTLIHEQR